jgi:hypothetical protein
MTSSLHSPASGRSNPQLEPSRVHEDDHCRTSGLGLRARANRSRCDALNRPQHTHARHLLHPKGQLTKPRALRSGTPGHIVRSNGGSGFSRTGAAFIEPGSPWENAFVESFNSRVRDELLSGEVFSCLAEAKVMVEDFRDDYNRRRPHRAHGMMTPTAFKTGWETAHWVAPASAELRARYAIAPFNAGDSLTLKEPNNHPLSQQVDR